MSIVTVYTTDEVAASLKVQPDWLREQVKAGRVSPLRLTSARNAPMRWTDADVARLVDSMRPVKPEPRRRKRRT